MKKTLQAHLVTDAAINRWNNVKSQHPRMSESGILNMLIEQEAERVEKSTPVITVEDLARQLEKLQKEMREVKEQLAKLANIKK